MNKLTREFNTKMMAPPLQAEREAMQREQLVEECSILCTEIDEMAGDDSLSLTALEALRDELQNLVDGL